ncbi:glypican-1b [Mugil cephalus]|uniref:glypican-1b n=1 Tax=Mugil cephalus TaxID=48193 RepID=UPI001FB5F2EB|nr:glypican-1b [Mugil cephalus]
MDSFIIAALALCSLTAPASGDKGTGKARSCSDIRQFYSDKGYPLDGVPQSEISGEHLRICPQGYTCCTSEMEDNLTTLSHGDVVMQLRELGRSSQISLNGYYKAFDSYFLGLLNRSSNHLQETFTQTWGSLYSQNTQVFSELYTELKHYYRGSSSSGNLEEVLNEFWAKLMEKIFSQANKKYVIGDDYLDCVSKQIETLEPFGYTPRSLKSTVTQTFVAARSFAQGLVVSGEVLRKVSQVPLGQECIRAIMKMTYCPHCRGIASARPCSNYCKNVMKGCLANQADLNTEWRHLAATLIQVAERMDGQSTVVLSLPNRISEAMHTMMENMNTINSKLYQACGTPREAASSSTGVDEIMRRGKITVEDKLGGITDTMDQLVSDVTMKLRDLQPYWVSLPTLLCTTRVANGTGAEDKCWNGMNRARYLPEVMGDGLASQINNPEVEIDITKPDMTIRQQIMQLKIMTHRLKNALLGQDVDFQDTSDDVSGSGSGMCADDACFRGPRIVVPITDKPLEYPSLPENKKVKASAKQNLPSNAIYLLSLLILLLRR